jgi:partner of Y14 and mago
MSRRPDGTLRKEVKVRPGYVAPDEAQKFTVDRIERSKVPVGYVSGAPALTTPSEPNKSKNQKRKEKKKVAKETVGGASNAEVKDDVKSATQQPTAEDAEKKKKNLMKKIRQINDLIAQQSQGKVLDADQLKKVGTRAQLELELSSCQ